MRDKETFSYVELPDGIFTADGIWYHTTEKDVAEFAPDLLHRSGLDVLLAQAGEWSRLPTAIAILGLAALLVLISPWQAALGSLSIYMFLAVVSPSVVIYNLSGLTRKLIHPVLQGLIYVLFLSYLASLGQMGAVGTGLLGFILFRWQLVGRLLSRPIRFLARPLSPLYMPDTILRNVLIRGSLKYGYSVGELQRMEERMTEIMTYHKTRSKQTGK